MPRLPTLTQLRHLIAVADFGHFGRAAESCLITQSSLSASIKELETGLDRILVERSRRSVMVTPLGERVVERARRVLRDVGDIVDLVEESRGLLRGSLRLGVIPTIGPFLLPRVLPSLRRAYPDLKLYLSEQPSAQLVDSLTGGSLDLVLLAFPYPTGRLQVHLFADDPLWAAFAGPRELDNKERLTGRDLEGREVILLEEGHCLRDHALGVCRFGDEAVSFQATSLHTLVQMVDNGLGLTVLPKMALDSGITKGTRVRTRPLEGKGAKRDIGFAWRPSSPRADEFALLAEFFRDELATPLRPRRRTN